MNGVTPLPSAVSVGPLPSETMPSSLFPAYRAAWEDDQAHDFRMHAREFMATQVTPHQARWSANKQVDRELWNKMGEAGLLCTETPEDLG